MTEKIENFTQMIENYYNKNGENYRFHFLPVRVTYKYYEYEADGGYTFLGISLREKEIRKYIVEYVPVLTKLPHSKRFIPLEEYEQVFRTGILDTIDTETYTTESVDIHSKIIELIHKKFKNISKEKLVKIISDEELNKIASLNGYKEFTWDIHDPYIELEYMYTSEKLEEFKDKRICDVYGVPLISNGNIDLTFLTDEQLFGDKALDVIKKCGTACEVTDFAYYSGGGYFSTLSDDRSRRTAPYWIKLPHMLPPISNPMYVDYDGRRKIKLPSSFSYRWVDDLVRYGSRPVVSYSSIKSMAYNEKINSLGIKEIYFGEYPQTEVNEDYANELESEYSSGNTRLTGKSYTTSSRIHEDVLKLGDATCFVDFEPISYPEIEYKGKRYVRINSQGCIHWIAVEPIKWLVDEKSDMAIAEKVFLAGIPYYDRESHKTDFYQTPVKRFMDKYVSKEILPNSQKNNLINESASSFEQLVDNSQSEELFEIKGEIDLENIELSIPSYSQLFGPNALDVIKKYGVEAEKTDLIYTNSIGYWLKTPYIAPGTIRIASDKGYCTLVAPEAFDKYRAAIRPILDCSKIISKLGRSNGIKKIIFGEYPQKAADEKIQKKLNKLYDKGKLNKTGRSYTIMCYGEPVNHEEFTYKENKYIKYEYAPAHYKWIEVMPVEWLLDEKTKLAIAKNILVDDVDYYNTKVRTSEEELDSNFENTEAYKYLNKYMVHDLFQGIQPVMKFETVAEEPEQEIEPEVVEPIEPIEQTIIEKPHRSIFDFFRRKNKVNPNYVSVLKSELDTLSYDILFNVPDGPEKDKLNARFDWVMDYYNNNFTRLNDDKQDLEDLLFREKLNDLILDVKLSIEKSNENIQKRI